VRVYLPESNQPAPVVLFSHGLGGSRSGNEFLGQHWARRGYVGVLSNIPGAILRCGKISRRKIG